MSCVFVNSNVYVNWLWYTVKICEYTCTLKKLYIQSTCDIIFDGLLPLSNNHNFSFWYESSFTRIFSFLLLYTSVTHLRITYTCTFYLFSDLNKISGTWICFEDLCIFAYFMFSFSSYCKRFHYTQIKHAESNSVRVNDDLTRSFIFALNCALVQFRTWHMTEICKYMYNNTGDYE